MARPKNVQKIPEPTYVPPEEEKPSQAENIISIVLGLAVVLVIGAMIVNAIRSRQNPANNPQPETTQEATSSGTHTVAAGETLWSIAEKYYNDGYKWVEIQKANNLASGDAVEVGTSLIIPTITPAMSPSPEASSASVAPTAPTEPTEPTAPTAPATPTAVPTVSITSSPAADTGSTGPTGATGSSAGQTLSIATDAKEYTVKRGDTLWAIAQARYNNPYRWVDIAKANNLRNPDLIYVDSKLTLPQ
jgi:nucleoid-associated protein YgaU